MKKAVIGFIIGAALMLFAVKYFPEHITHRDINNQMINAALWMRTSAEYRALCYQAYNTALERLKAAAKDFKSGDKPIAVILDCDETVLDNTAYDSSFIDTDKDNSDSALFYEYQMAGNAKAMPGAEEFLKAVDALSVDIFYVTNRQERFKEATLQNLKALDFPQIDNAHVVMKTDTSSKDPRFNTISEIYNVVVYLGDSMHDFKLGIYGKNMTDRNTITDKNRTLFGVKYIVLPNPMYGSWRGAYADGYRNMSLDDRHKADMKALNHMP